jgi:hypothetical protein
MGCDDPAVPGQIGWRRISVEPWKDDHELALDRWAQALPPEYEMAVLGAIRHIGDVLAHDPRGSVDEAGAFVAHALRASGGPRCRSARSRWPAWRTGCSSTAPGRATRKSGWRPSPTCSGGRSDPDASSIASRSFTHPQDFRVG